MAHQAIMRVVVGGVIVSAHVVRLMARPTILRRTCVLAVHVAFRAAYSQVSAGEREAAQIVVEGSRLPSGCRVTLCARVREVTGLMVGIIGTGEIRLMT